MTMTKMLINFYYIFFCRVQRYQENKQMVKAGLKEPRGNASKKPVDFVGDFVPPENDNLAVKRHLKALVREERNKKRRPGVISTLMRETQLYKGGRDSFSRGVLQSEGDL